MNDGTAIIESYYLLASNRRQRQRGKTHKELRDPEFVVAAACDSDNFVLCLVEKTLKLQFDYFDHYYYYY